MSTNQAQTEFNWPTARVVRDPAYPSCYVIEDGGGRIARKRKSHRQTCAPERRFKSERAARAAIDEATKGESK